MTTTETVRPTANISRVSATPAALDLIVKISAMHGPLMFHQSGGCCDGSAPMCYPRPEFKVGAQDVFMGEIGGQPLYMGKSQFEYWQHTHIIIDVVPGRGSGFSLEAPEGVRFLTRSRIYSDAENDALDAMGPPPTGVERPVDIASANDYKISMTETRSAPMSASITLRELTGLGHTPTTIGKSALILIDCQNTYREGVMQLEGVEPALVECQKLLARYRDAGRPVIHIQHDAGKGTPYDVSDRIGAIADVVQPRAGEPVVVKNYPSSFEKTNLNDLLKGYGVEDLTIAGFMTHVCVNSTARAAFNHGYKTTVVAAATATRSLPNPTGGVTPAKALHDASLTALHDMFAVVVPNGDDVKA